MKRFFKIAAALVIFLVPAFHSIAQTPTYSCVATADTLVTSKIYQFDVYIYRTGTTLFYMNNFQLSFKINNTAGILNGGTVTGSYVAGSSALPVAFLPGGVSVFNVGGTLEARINGCPSTSNGTLIPVTGLKIGSFRLTNTNDYGQLNPGMIWWDATPATTYVYGIVPPAPTGTVVEISNMTFHTTNFADPILNGPVTAFNVTGTGSYCASGTGLTVGLSGSQTGVMYRLIKNGTGVGSYIPGTGAALSFGLQTVGTYTVTAYRKATYITNMMTGSAVITTVTVTPTLAGNGSVCSGATGNVYTTEAGMTTYVWSVSAGGTITAGGTATSNTVTVTWSSLGAQTVSVNYTNGIGCTAATPSVKNVTVLALPVPTITGQNSICANSGYITYTTEPGMTGYTWSTSAGGTITGGQGTNAVMVNWTVGGNQSVSVVYTNGAGCSSVVPTVYPVTVNSVPSAAGVISGTAAVCGGTQGVAYSCATIAGASYYVWTLPTGATIASGTGTNSITVNFAANGSSGNITVYGNNLCGNGAVSPNFPVTVTAMPAAAGTITGPSEVCNGSTGIVFAVAAIANATNYTWTVPSGATIISGGTTNTITVNFSNTASSGNITVFGSNNCGNGSVSPAFAVTVNPIPAAPVVVALSDTVSSSAASGNQWYFSATSGGSGNLVPGATAQTHVATETGWYWSVVTLGGCSSPESNRVYVIVTGINELEATNWKIFPVPNDGHFSITVEHAGQSKFTIEAYNNLGARIYQQREITISGTTLLNIDLRPIPNGVYTIVLRNDKGQLIRSILVNK